MSWGKIYCDTNWGENKYRTAGSIINEATPDCFQFPEFVSFKDHVRSEGATYEKMQCGIDILLFLGRSISITPQSPDNPTFSGILDTYTGATAGYSTRRLTNTYTGGLIRVRRSSDDAEQDIGYDANGEDLDIFGLLAFVGTSGTDNGYVTTWYDQTGNGNHATNSTASEQPLIVDGGSIIYEGATISRPAMEFDGVDDFLGITTGPTILPSTGDISSFSVFSGDTSVSGYIYSNTTSADDRHGLGLQFFSGALRINGALRIGGTWSIYEEQLITADEQYLLSAFKSGVDLYVDGIKSTGGLNGLFTGPSNTFHIGANTNATSSLNGKLQEMIFYDSDETSNRTGIEGNIDNYFRITS
jgi:hypothetical protein